MAKDFGKEVAGLVGELTLDMSISAFDRKQLMLEQCSQMSLEAKIIKLADRLDNMRDNMGSLGEAFINRYCAEAEIMLKKMRGASPFLEEELMKIIQKHKP
jgi:guanosine-3',5'-bis(diphosphate) 3'-pyrophosphohydrolase